MEIIRKVKFEGDQEILNIFKNVIRREAKKHYKNYKVVYVPLSEERRQERDFNQSLVLAKYTGLEVLDCLIRLDGKKQSKKSLEERMSDPPKFELKFLPESKNLLIVDDIFTTGSTLRSIMSLFDNSYNMKCLTLIRIKPRY